MVSSSEGASPDRSVPPPDRKTPEEVERPDWLVGADEIMASEADLRSANDARAETRKPAPAPPLAAATPAPSPPPAPSEHTIAARAPASRADLPTRAPGTSPIPDPPGLVSRIDLDDFRQDEKAATAPDLPALPSAFPAEPAIAWADESPAPEPRVRAPQSAPTPAARPPAHKPKNPSFWAIASKTLLTDRRIHVALAVLAITAMVLSITREQLTFTRVSHIRRDPVKFDGKPVKLRGTVAEVFAIGSSYTYYLLDGRDTIVVFTRSRPPQPHQRITVEGSVSTGYLEGVPRAAVFQQESP